MSVFLGILLGLGGLLVWMSAWYVPEAEPRAPRVSTTAQLLRQADMEKISVRLFWLMSGVAGLVALVLVFALTSIVPLSFLAAGMGVLAPRLLVAHRARQRQAVLRDLWPDAVDHLRSAIRAGLSLPDALMQL